MSAGPTSSLVQEPEMAEQPTWPSRTIILGPTTLTHGCNSRAHVDQWPLTDEKEGIGIWKVCHIAQGTTYYL